MPHGGGREARTKDERATPRVKKHTHGGGSEGERASPRVKRKAAWPTKNEQKKEEDDGSKEEQHEAPAVEAPAAAVEVPRSAIAPAPGARGSSRGGSSSTRLQPRARSNRGPRSAMPHGGGRGATEVNAPRGPRGGRLQPRLEPRTRQTLTVMSGALSRATRNSRTIWPLR